MKVSISSILTFILCCCVNAQSGNDTLSNKSYQDLKEIFYDFHKQFKDKKSRKIALFTLAKAKKESNVREISNAYMRLYGTYFNDEKIGLKYLDSSIYISNESGNRDLLSEALFLRGNLYYFMGKDELATKDYLKSLENITYNKELLRRVKYNIGVIKADLGEDKEAIKIFKECYAIDKSKSLSEKFVYNDLTESIYGISNSYVNLEIIDSASKYNHEGYNLGLANRDSMYFRFTYLEGINEYNNSKYNNSKDSILKSLDYLIKTEDYQNLAIAYYYLGEIFEKKNLKNRSIQYFKKVDSIYEATKYIYPKTRPSFEKLIKYYESKNDLNKQLYYVKKLLKIDSTLHNRYKNISFKIFKEFDKKNLITEKANLQNKLKKSQSSFFYKNILYIIIIFIITVIAISFYRKQYLYKKKFKILINSKDQLEVNESAKSKLSNHNKKDSLNLNPELIENVLDRLKEFEDNLEFLEKGITLKKLATVCNTNSKYLSHIINKYKEKNFRNYINDLRIDYVVERIKSDQEFRNLTILAISDLAGFSNSESYAKAFYKRTGIHTSYFIKNIKKLESQ